MYLHPNMLQTPHYQVISVVICIPQKFQVNELHLHWSQPQWHEKLRSQSVKWGMERRKEEEEEESLHRGRQCSLQHDGNKEQMECSCQNELTFIFYYLLSILSLFLISNLFSQEWGYTLTPLPMRIQTKLSVSSPRRLMPRVSKLRKS